MAATQQSKIDWPSFLTALFIIVGVCLPLVAAPEAGGILLQQMYAFIAHQLGFLYQLAGIAVLILVIWLAFGRYGSIKTGGT